MSARADSTRFDEVVLPQLDAAYNLARWLTRNGHDAEDVVQEACERALKYFDAFRVFSSSSSRDSPRASSR